MTLPAHIEIGCTVVLLLAVLHATLLLTVSPLALTHVRALTHAPTLSDVLTHSLVRVLAHTLTHTLVNASASALTHALALTHVIPTP